MRYIDITLPLAASTPAYPGDPPVSVQPWSSIVAGAEYNVSALRLGSHAGTHVDAPLHCFPGGAAVDALPLDVLCGPALVLDATRAGLPELPVPSDAACSRLLLRTRGGRAWHEQDASRWSGLDHDAAWALIERNVRLVGIDRLSIAEGDATLSVHRLLLKNGVVIVEGLDLRPAPPGRYGLLCLPLRIAGGDGAPARVVLTAEE